MEEDRKRDETVYPPKRRSEDEEEDDKTPAISSQNKKNVSIGPAVPVKVAIKQLSKEKIVAIESGIDFLLNEIHVHWALEQCVSVVRLLNLFEDENHIYMVLEYQPNGTLLKTLKSN